MPQPAGEGGGWLLVGLPTTVGCLPTRSPWLASQPQPPAVKNGATSLFSFTFNAPNDTAAFVGVAGATLFDRVEIRETVGTDDNEFYGRVYAGTQAIPEPSSLISAALGLAGLAEYAGRRRVRARRAP